MNDKMILMLTMVMSAVIAGCGVAYVYRDKVKKALAEPGQALLYLAQEWEDFISKESTKQSIKALCRLADQIVTGDGGDRLLFVCGKLYALVPKSLQTVITIDKLVAVVNAVYDEIKVYIDGHWVAGE